MKLDIFLTICLVSMVNAVPDQRWSDVRKMEARLSDIEHTMLEMNMMNMAMASRMETVENKNEQLEKENIHLRNEIQELRAEVSSSPLISFTAIMTSGQFVGSGDYIVPFEETIANPGGHYDVTTYKFTCPSDSMYFFTFNLYSDALQYAVSDYYLLAGRLILDGTEIVETFSRNLDANVADYRTVSASAIILCNIGSEVYVTAPYTDIGIYGTSGSPRTTFSGFIL